MFTLPYRNYCRLTVGENRSPKNGQSTVGMDFHISGQKNTAYMKLLSYMLYHNAIIIILNLIIYIFYHRSVVI